MSVRTNFADIYLRGMCDRRMRSGMELGREIQLIDWSRAGSLPNRFSGVQIPQDICTRFGRYLFSTKCSWIINYHIGIHQSKGPKGELELLNYNIYIIKQNKDEF